MAIIEFGNFADGSSSTEIFDTSQNWFSPHVTINPSGGGPNGGNYARLVADDTMQFPNQDVGTTAHVRIHGIGFKAGRPAWFKNGNEIWRGLSLRVPSGYTNTERPTTDELHGDNNTGPAPLNLSFRRAENFRVYIRGGSAPPAFNQWIFGPDDGSGSTTTRHHQDWAGGNKTVVLDEWVHFRMGWFMATDTTGWFEAYARWGSMTSWLNIVPRMTGIPTSYPDTDGDGFQLGPYMSLYYDVGSGNQNAVDYAAGFYADSLANLTAKQDSRLGFSAGSGIPTGGSTFGKTDVGVSTLGDITDYKHGSPFTLAEAGSVTDIWAYIATTATSTLKATINTMVAGAPTVLKGTSAAVTLTGANAGAWTQFHFASPVTLTAGDYLLGTINGSGSSNTYTIACDPVTAQLQVRVDSYSTGPTDPWISSVGGGFTGVYDNQLSIYAAYTATSAPGSPTLSSAVVDGIALQLIYDLSLDLTSVPDGGAFTVKVGGVAQASPTAVAIAGQIVTLTLAAAVAVGDTVTVSYTAGTAPIQGIAGADAATLTNHAVTNNTVGAIRRVQTLGGRSGGSRVNSPASKIVGGGGFA